MQDDDRSLFEQEMQDVAPLAKGRRQDRAVPKQDTVGHQQRRDAAEGRDTDVVDPNFLTLADVPAKAPLEYLEWKKDGVQNAVFSKLRHAGYPIDERLDLHRKTVKEARQWTFGFLKHATAKGFRCLLISHGKGELSKTPGRLKSYLAAWLIQHPEVIAYCSAERQHGGVGAVYVLVRKSQEHKELNREEYGLKSDADDGLDRGL